MNSEPQPLKIYFITHPEFDIDARVVAPNSKRAKTAYLDFLSRNGYIEWWNRGYHRRRLVVKRATGQEDVDVVLHYLGSAEGIPEKAVPSAPRPSPRPAFRRPSSDIWREESLF